MNKVKFVECSDGQATFGRSVDPRPHLEIGQIYELMQKEVHPWHTLYYLKGHETKPFNSVCFVDVE